MTASFPGTRLEIGTGAARIKSTVYVTSDLLYYTFLVGMNERWLFLHGWMISSGRQRYPRGCRYLESNKEESTPVPLSSF